MIWVNVGLVPVPAAVMPSFKSIGGPVSPGDWVTVTAWDCDNQYRLNQELMYFMCTID